MGLLTAAQTSYPSFGYMLLSPAEPATTLWELWDSDKQVRPCTPYTRRLTWLLKTRVVWLSSCGRARA